jgi:hypothetical protein
MTQDSIGETTNGVRSIMVNPVANGTRRCMHGGALARACYVYEIIHEFSDNGLVIEGGNLNPHPLAIVGFSLTKRSFHQNDLTGAPITERLDEFWPSAFRFLHGFIDAGVRIITKEGNTLPIPQRS